MVRIDKEELIEVVRRFRELEILVVGDAMVDEYVWGEVERISPEAPVPIVLVDGETKILGGAANVAHNLSTLGVKTSLVAVVGDDDHGKFIKKRLEELGIKDGTVVDSSRPTTLKTRIIARGQQVVRVDREKTHSVAGDVYEQVIENYHRAAGTADAIILSDYGKGVIVPEVINEIVVSSKEMGKILTVDPKTDHFHLYKGVTTLTPNKHEAQYATGIKISDENSLKEAGMKLKKDLNCEFVVITLGADGMAIFENESGEYHHIPTVAKKVYDVTGAGDTVISVLTAAYVSGLDPYHSAVLANLAAGIEISKLGSAQVTPNELIKGIRHL